MDKSVSDNLISVIVPVYNSQDYLDVCIHSICEQTYNNIEIIIVDDGSTDDSGMLCDKYASNDSRIRVIHTSNEGLVTARKIGIKKACGEYITFVDSDDYIDRDSFEKLMGKLGTRRPDMVLYDLIEEYPDHSCQKLNHFTEGYYTKEAIRKSIIPSMLSCGVFFDFGILPNLVCKMIRREFIRNVDLIVDKRIMIGEDVVHTFQLIPQVNDLMIIKYAPYHYFKRYDSMMWKKTDSYRVEALKANLENCFNRLGIWKIMEVQLKQYLLFVTLLKTPFDLLRKSRPFSNPQLRIALYGAGGMGQAVYNYFSNVVTLWVDRAADTLSNINTAIKGVDHLFSDLYEYDEVVIAILNTDTSKRILNDLRNRGLQKRIHYFDENGIVCGSGDNE